MNQKEISIKQLKKELELKQSDIADMFNMTAGAFANSSAKPRYENALCTFYLHIKTRKRKIN